MLRGNSPLSVNKAVVGPPARSICYLYHPNWNGITGRVQANPSINMKGLALKLQSCCWYSTKNNPFKPEISDKSPTLATSTLINPETSGNIKRILALSKPEMPLILGAIGLLFISSGVSMFVPFSMGAILDLVMNSLGGSVPSPSLPPSPSLLPDTPSSSFLSELLAKNYSFPVLFSGLFAILATGALANASRFILFKIAGEKIIMRFRSIIYDSLIRKDIAFHDTHRPGELLSRLSGDSVIVGKVVTNNISDLLRNFVMATVGLGMMSFVSLKLTGIIMLMVPPVSLLAVAYGRVVQRIAKDMTNATASMSKTATEKLSNVKTVRAFSMQVRESEAFASSTKDIFSLGRKEGFISGAFFGIAGFSGNAIMLAILYYGGSMVQAGTISIGELTSFFLYTAYVGSSMVGLTSCFSEIMKGIGVSAKLFEILDHQNHIEADVSSNVQNRKIPAPLLAGKVEFDQVSFAYPTRPTSIFSNLSFTVLSGQSVSIVGFSGSGKSTIAQLLLRFYDPAQGRIRIDGEELTKLDLNWYRSHVIAIVPQEPALFAGTIRENIAYGCPSATEAEILKAADQANATSFIESFPAGMDTLVGEGGKSISGGQKQRIAIARALLKNPRILVLDEATSALDGASEAAVQSALEEASKGRTVITIAHRLSTIQKADVILVLKDGKVVESGSFDELVSKPDGQFYALIKEQHLAPVSAQNEAEANP